MKPAGLRLRPILMTSFAFIMGVIPLVTASGAGSEMRQAIGIAVFAGMLGVTSFGLFLTPVSSSPSKRGWRGTGSTRTIRRCRLTPSPEEPPRA